MNQQKSGAGGEEMSTLTKDGCPKGESAYTVSDMEIVDCLLKCTKHCGYSVLRNSKYVNRFQLRCPRCGARVGVASLILDAAVCATVNELCGCLT